MYNNSATSTMIVSGPVYFRNRSDGGKLLYISDIGKFEISQSVETKDLVSGRAGKGAKLKSLSRLKDVKLKLSLNEVNSKALEIALRAGVTSVAAGTVTDELLESVGVDALARFDFVPNLTQTITVKSEDGNTTYQKDVDYNLEVYGIVPKSGGAIVADSNVKVSYTKLASAVIGALMNSGKEYEIVLNGTNEAESDRKLCVRIPRVTFTPASTFSVISADFGTLEIEGDILSDAAETALYYVIPENAA